VREDEEEEDEADIDERAVPGEWSRCGGARDATAFDLDLQKATFSTKAVSRRLNSAASPS
jgi:IS4 transposase